MKCPCRPSLLLLLVAGWAGAALGAPRAALADGGLVVTGYWPARLQLGGNDYVLVRGMLENRGAFGVGLVTVGLKVYGVDEMTPLAEGSGQAFLDRLAPGERSPFTVAVRHCCPEDLQRYAFSLEGPEQRAAPYRELAVRLELRRTGPRGPERSAELVNLGRRPVNAPSLDVYAAYWQGDNLLDLRTANLPVLWNLVGPTGQALAPGMVYPLVVAEPEQPFDRVEYFINGTPYPAGQYPVPLGARAERLWWDGDDLLWRVLLQNCGSAPVGSAVLILDWRDAQGWVRGFARWDLDLGEGLAPGAGRWVQLRLSEAPEALLGPGERRLLPLGLAVQDREPAEYHCPVQSWHLELPALSNQREVSP